MSDDRLADVELSPTQWRRVADLSESSTPFTEREATRILKFVQLPRSERTPSMLQPTDTAARDKNGSTDRHTADDGDSNVCARLRRRVRDADRLADVVDEYPGMHTSAIFRHIEGRCSCRDVGEPAVKSPSVTAVECMDMREQYRSGHTRQEIAENTHRSSGSVLRHVFNRCRHTGHDIETRKRLSSTECAALRDAYARVSSTSVRSLAAAFACSTSTAHKHLSGDCDHDVDVDAKPADTGVDASTCGRLRRSYKSGHGIVAKVARDVGVSRSTADYHIFGRCSCDDAGEPPADRG